MKNEKFKIKNIKAREIFDSRGNPTIEVELETDLGKFLDSVPAGASKGKYEAVELRDGGERYHGMGVIIAVKNINEIISSKLIGKDPRNQKEIDEILINLDRTENKSKLGANAICGVSLAVCRAGAAAKNLRLWHHISELTETGSLSVLPRPCFNVINGGVHAGNELDFQEFMVVPQAPTPKFSGEGQENSFSENLRIGSEIYHQLKEILSKKYGKQATNLGDEGGFAPPMRLPEEAIELILEAAKKLNYENKIKLILDIAASQFFKSGKYKMKNNIFTSEGLMRYYSKLISNYPTWGLEDPFSEDDWEGWEQISNVKSQMSNLLVIGDDLTVTNPKRIALAQEKKACNAIVLKINQIGTVTEAIEAGILAKEFGWKIIVSHRSGETNDDFISDFAVGIGADFIKAGAPARGERVAKYNRLLKIEEEFRKNVIS